MNTPEQEHYLQIGKGNKAHCDMKNKIGFTFADCPKCNKPTPKYTKGAEVFIPVCEEGSDYIDEHKNPINIRRAVVCSSKYSRTDKKFTYILKNWISRWDEDELYTTEDAIVSKLELTNTTRFYTSTGEDAISAIAKWIEEA